MGHSEGREGGRDCLKVVDSVEGSLLEERSSMKPLANTSVDVSRAVVKEGIWTYCFRYSRLRALLFGSRPGGGLPMRFVPCGPFVNCTPAQVCGLLLGFEGGFPFGWPPDMRSWGKEESKR